MPAKALTPDQLADAARLKKAFENFQEQLKDEGKPCSQLAITSEENFPFGQSALSQYLNGKIPLNGEALQVFCKLMQVEPETISPLIVQEAVASSQAWVKPATIHLGISEQQPKWSVKPEKWPFKHLDQAKVFALKGTLAAAVEASILAAASALDVDLSVADKQRIASKAPAKSIRSTPGRASPIGGRNIRSA